MKIIQKIFWTVIMYIALPIDYIGWNLIFGGHFSYRSFKQCVKDGRAQLIKYKEKIDAQ